MKGPVKTYKGVDWHGASEFGDYFKVGATPVFFANDN